MVLIIISSNFEASHKHKGKKIYLRWWGDALDENVQTAPRGECGFFPVSVRGALRADASEHVVYI